MGGAAIGSELSIISIQYIGPNELSAIDDQIPQLASSSPVIFDRSRSGVAGGPISGEGDSSVAFLLAVDCAYSGSDLIEANAEIWRRVIIPIGVGMQSDRVRYLENATR